MPPTQPRSRSARRLIALAVSALSLAALLSLRGTHAEAGEGWWGALDEGETVSLSNVIRQPDQFRGRTLTFNCVFHTAAPKFKYYPPNTAFRETLFMNFQVWADGAIVWDEKTYKNSFPFLYLRRTNAQRGELVQVKRFTRIECTGRIRDIVRGRPAIEVFSFRETGHRLGKPVVDSILWGLNYSRDGTRSGYQSAARRFKQALQPDLPPVYAIIVRKYLADTLRHLGHDSEADLYERGETVGTPPLPEPDRDGPGLPTMDDLPGAPTEFPETDLPPAGPGPSDLGPLASGDGAGSPDGPLPPAPLPPTGRRPARAQPSGSSGMPQPPSDNPFASDDLPGRTATPRAPRGEQGTPDGTQPGRSRFDGTSPRQSPGGTRRGAPAKGRRTTGIPPKRRPRLSGVK